MTTSPAILLALQHDVNPNDISQLLWGVEEESIPLQTINSDEDNVIRRAWLAANQSPLLVGVAISPRQIIVHYKNLAAEQPLFTLNDYKQSNPKQLRDLGCNIARLVKGLPFKPLNIE